MQATHRPKNFARSGAFLGAIALGAAAIQAQAQTPIPVANQGFESPSTQSATSPNGWTTFNSGATGFSGAYNPYEFGGGNVYYTGANLTTDPANGGSGYPGIFGENLGYSRNQSALSGLTQTLSTTFTAHTSYMLMVEVGNRNGTNAGGFAGSEIEILAGNTVVASSTDTVGPTAGTFRDQSASLVNSDADPSLFGQQLRIEILTTNSAALNRATDWDNVRLTQTTLAAPEPSSVVAFAVAGLFTAGLMLRARKTRPA